MAGFLNDLGKFPDSAPEWERPLVVKVGSNPPLVFCRRARALRGLAVFSAEESGPENCPAPNTEDSTAEQVGGQVEDTDA